MAKEMTLVSVGIDIGTTTTQVVISQLTLMNVMPGSQVPKVMINHKSILYMGSVHFTPFEDRKHVNSRVLREIIAKEYEKAGIKPHQIDTGAIIITGEAAKKENASEIIHTLADFAGDFVVATAGPDLESVIAGRGSGAEALSKRLKKCIANIDIGGGTTNIAYFDQGKCLGTACLSVGGRLLEVDPFTHHLSFISSPAQAILSYLFENIMAQNEDEVIRIRLCLRTMIESVERVIFHRPLYEIDEHLVITNTLPKVRPDGIVFSGGVAQYIYHPGIKEWWLHGDVGPLLAEMFRESNIFTSFEVYHGSETLHATVLGAGAHTVDVSGSTILVSENTLPLRNIPIVYPENEESGGFSWLKPAAGYDKTLYRTIALVIPTLPDMNFSTICWIAETLAKELPFIKGDPKVVVTQQDIAKVLGQALQRLLPSVSLVCLDGIEFNLGDFIDIAKPLPLEDTVPVIVKTLVFSH
jgi:ethanolamine utilization protein EutA